jgi:hypothetical protein
VVGWDAEVRQTWRCYHPVQSDTFGFNPDIAQEVTLGAEWDDDFVGGTESADVIHDVLGASQNWCDACSFDGKN